MRYHDPQSESAGQRRKQRRSDGMDMQDVGSYKRRPQHTEKSMDESLKAGDPRSPDPRQLDAAPSRVARLCHITAADDRFDATSERDQRASQVLGVLLHTALHVRKAADSEHGDAQGAAAALLLDPRHVGDLIHRTRAESAL